MALLKTLVFVLIAEMGDKTQIMTMTFASKYKARDVAIGITISILLLNTIAVVVGSYLSSLIPLQYIELASALAFLGFGLWTLKNRNEEEEEEVKEGKRELGPVAAVAVGFFLAELGDKTQLATLALAADYKQPVMVLIGSSLGLLLANALGILGGNFISKHVSERFIKWGAAVVFLVFGIITLYEAVPVQFLKAIYIIPFIILFGVMIYLFGFKLAKVEAK